MKQIVKRRILLALLALLLALSSFIFAGCGQTQEQELCKVTVVLGDKSYEAETRVRTVHELLQEMKANGVIEAYEFSGTRFTPYVTKIDTVVGKFEVDGKYIAVFHDIDEMSLKYYGLAGYVTKEHMGREFFYSNIGVALLPVVDGASYWFFATDESFM